MTPNQDPQISPGRQRDLQLRIASSLGSLKILARQSLPGLGAPVAELLSQIDHLRDEYDGGMMRAFTDRAAALSHRYPVNITGLTARDAGARDVQEGERIYRRLCLGCHEAPAMTRDNPAQDLFTLAQTMPEREFIARMIGGVHGTPEVALGNPLSDAEIAGMVAYLSGLH